VNITARSPAYVDCEIPAPPLPTTGATGAGGLALAAGDRLPPVEADATRKPKTNPKRQQSIRIEAPVIATTQWSAG
jgi:hypothetical protein